MELDNNQKLVLELILTETLDIDEHLKLVGQMTDAGFTDSDIDEIAQSILDKLREGTPNRKIVKQ